MKLTNLIQILFLLHLLCKSSYAGITIEPFLGGELGTWKSEEAFPLSEYDVSGTQAGMSYGLYYGSRVYMGLLKAFFFGAEYSQTKNQWNVSDDEEQSEDDSWQGVSAERKTLSFIFGLQKPGSSGPLYKLWIGFSPLETLILSQPHQPTHPQQSSITYRGSSLSVGFSWPLTSWLYSNLEFSTVNMNKRTQDGTDFDIPGSSNFQTYTSYSYQTFLVSISMPLTIFKKKVGW